MKYLALIIGLFTFTSYAGPKDFMVCLGKAESRIHKEKIGGAFYNLNKEIISSFVQFSEHIDILDSYTKDICQAEFPSLKILNYLLTTRKIFEIGRSTPQQTAIDKTAVKELQSKSIYIFINFISKLQAQMPKANCLYLHVPKLKIFHEKMQYTLEEEGIKNILKVLRPIDDVFKRIAKIPNSKKKC